MLLWPLWDVLLIRFHEFYLWFFMLFDANEISVCDFMLFAVQFSYEASLGHFTLFTAQPSYAISCFLAVTRFPFQIWCCVKDFLKEFWCILAPMRFPWVFFAVGCVIFLWDFLMILYAFWSTFFNWDFRLKFYAFCCTFFFGSYEIFVWDLCFLALMHVMRFP